ncbi:Mitochondrial thioredoxin [Apiospora kogelbergensis]|uniref:Mitochondrial thioredoxin n=1 Tax=Apiospora kogelbergensis TaxID=1337665 RepID=UPI00312E82F0
MRVAPRSAPSITSAAKSLANKPIQLQRAAFSTSRQNNARNQIYDTVRNPAAFQTYLQLSSSSRTPLLTFWTTSWCGTCRKVKPLLEELVGSGVGEAEGGVGLVEVECDAPDVMNENMGMTYMITSIPTLLSFDGGEAMTQTKVVDARRLRDRAWLEEWIRTEAKRHGGRGGGGGGAGGLLEGLFGSWKN